MKKHAFFYILSIFFFAHCSNYVERKNPRILYQGLRYRDTLYMIERDSGTTNYHLAVYTKSKGKIVDLPSTGLGVLDSVHKDTIYTHRFSYVNKSDDSLDTKVTSTFFLLVLKKWVVVKTVEANCLANSPDVDWKFVLIRGDTAYFENSKSFLNPLHIRHITHSQDRLVTLTFTYGCTGSRSLSTSSQSKQVQAYFDMLFDF